MDHMDMDMNMHMGGGDDTTSNVVLSADGIDFSNSTQAAEFLDDLLNDDELKIIGNNYAKYFWYGVVVIVGLATLANFLNWLTLQGRLRAAARKRQQPARPSIIFSRWLATATAIAREVSYPQITPTARCLWFKVPPLGTILLLMSYLAFVLALEFIDNDVAGVQYWQALGVRAGWLSVAQMPLLILLINKNNVIGALTGTSYERLNVLHRWSSRIMLLMAILHFSYQSYGWQQYPGLMQLEWATDDCPTTGIAAFALLLWMNLSTLAPVRYWSYEFFIVQHIITFFGFVIAVVYHLPSTALGSRVYVFIPVGLYLVDRIVRSLLYAWTNMRASRATMVQLGGGVTKITITNKSITTWRAGSHVLLSIPRFGVMQSHPATILSTPQSHGGALVFLLKSHKGFTLRIMEGANSSETALLPHKNAESESEQRAQVVNTQHLALLDGPWGGSQSDMAAFDSVLLLAGSTGVTFTLSLLQDLADRASSCGKRLPVQMVHFIWCVRSSEQTMWVSGEIEEAHRKLQDAGIDARISIYVTCAEQFTELGNEPKECGCACDKSQGPCCCVLVDEDDEGVDVDAIKTSGRGKNATLVNEKSASPSPTRQLLTQGRRMPMLPCATFYSGRLDIRETVSSLLDDAEGESGIAVCGPIGLSSEVRNTVVRLSDERAIHKGTSAQGCALHVETFS
ncbi:related to ferric reductase (metalloreductase) [Ramularia collo-cygni]|uniref:Related to ferric reductase (Metalloreductase) n=1 Tax=Ramularia collo-cygni TaxID=112498 RepID=A0A2D3UYX9_9PEZI|nr:related to ferric reductase (metalloreductase) [Ramularia collo-cygni]CZT17577.1 related to ferric reductase (metalloreductase) [Ramularia collo-cygni]